MVQAFLNSGHAIPYRRTRHAAILTNQSLPRNVLRIGLTGTGGGEARGVPEPGSVTPFSAGTRGFSPDAFSFRSAGGVRERIARERRDSRRER